MSDATPMRPDQSALRVSPFRHNLQTHGAQPAMLTGGRASISEQWLPLIFCLMCPSSHAFDKIMHPIFDKLICTHDFGIPTVSAVLSVTPRTPLVDVVCCLSSSSTLA